VLTTVSTRRATHLLHIELIRLLIVACVMVVPSSSMAVESYRYWQDLEHAVVYADPEHPKHAQRLSVQPACWPCKNRDVFSFQELCTDPCNKGTCIIMKQHEVMVVDEWQTPTLIPESFRLDHSQLLLLSAASDTAQRNSWPLNLTSLRNWVVECATKP